MLLALLVVLITLLFFFVCKHVLDKAHDRPVRVEPLHRTSLFLLFRLILRDERWICPGSSVLATVLLFRNVGLVPHLRSRSGIWFHKSSLEGRASGRWNWVRLLCEKVALPCASKLPLVPQLFPVFVPQRFLVSLEPSHFSRLSHIFLLLLPHGRLFECIKFSFFGLAQLSMARLPLLLPSCSLLSSAGLGLADDVTISMAIGIFDVIVIVTVVVAGRGNWFVV